MELLVVIAILAVMVAITAPNLASIARVAEMNRLDNYAKEMYVAVQDQFITMEASGEYEQFNKTLIAQTNNRSLGTLGVMPHDATDSEWVNYYYVQNGSEFTENAADDAFAQVVSRSAIVDGLTSGGRYIAELNPRNDGTDVYSVFYSEDPNFSYNDVISLASRERTDRTYTTSGYPVGYYCGVTAASPEIPDHFSPRATFVNGEELFLKVVCAGGVGLVGNEQNMELRLTLSDGTRSQTVSYYGGQDFSLGPSGNVDVDILIDSMRDGLHLADIFPDFEPGTDINATVEVLYTSDTLTITTPAEEQGQAKANSLYARNINGAIEVANVRHMNNLRLLPGSITSVLQTSDIDFDATTWGTSDTTELSQSTKQNNLDTYGTEYINPLDPRTTNDAQGFEPLEAQDAAWFFDGSNNQLKNFYIEGNGATGLFAVVQAGQVVRNTLLVDPVVEGGGATGALCGELAGSIENSGVRLDIHTAEDLDKLNSCFVTSVGSEPVGGLVGQATGNASISRSYAAINVVASNSGAAGGLVGQFSASGAITESYSSGSVDAAGSTGGLLGALVQGSVYSCYSTSDVYSPATAGGFVGSASGGSVSDSYAYGSVGGASGGGFVGNTGASFTNCAYLTEVGYNETLLDQPSGVEGRGYSALADMRLAADHSFPYMESLFGKAFPFANVVEEHWGNWPGSMSLKPILVYYEKYGEAGDGGIGFYGTGQTDEGVVTIDTLDGPNGGLVISEDGYALLATNSIRGFEYSLNGGESQRLTVADSPQSSSFVDMGIDSLEYWNGSEMCTMEDIHVYQLPFELQMPNRTAEYFLDTLELTFADAGGTAAESFLYYYNPDFAMLSASPNIDGTTAEPDTSNLFVRTPRHLSRLAQQPAYWASNANIVQYYDIDYSYYTADYLGEVVNYTDTSGAYAPQPIGNMSQPFGGTYDGTGHVIIDYNQYISGGALAGLFGVVSGTVTNTHIASSRQDLAVIVRTGAVPSGTLAAGAIAAWVDGGTISGCSASGYQVFIDGSFAIADAAVGGLVGVNVGTVDRSSSADNTVTIVSSAPGSASLGVGGLVGGLQGRITNSYSVSNTLVCQATGSGLGRQLAQGGIAGYIYSGGASISNCYGYAFAEDTISNTGDFVSHFDIASSDGCDISNCYRLSWEEGEGGRYDSFTTGAEDGAEVRSCTPETLMSNPLGGAFVTSDGAPTYGNAYFYDTRIVMGHLVPGSWSYPYPLVCTNNDGEYSHFGFDWWE